MAMTYTVIGPVVKRVTRNINKPPKDPKPQKGGASAFENAIEALSPLAWYRFREPNFTTRVKDSTSNGHHLTKQLAAATRSAVKTRTTHPGGAYFPAVTYDNWATLGTFYKSSSLSILNAASACTMLVSMRMIDAPSNDDGYLCGAGVENLTDVGDNQQWMLTSDTTNDEVFVSRGNAGGGGLPCGTDVTEICSDGVNRLYIVRFAQNTIYRLTTSKPGHEALTEATALSTGALDALNRAILMNARPNSTTGSATTTGMVIDQVAIWASDIGAVAEADLHSKWSDEVAGAGYYPSMMQFDGSTGYYSAGYTAPVHTGKTIEGRFIIPSFTGGANQYILGQTITTGSRLAGLVANSNDHATVGRRGKLQLFVQNSSGTLICRIFSSIVVTDNLPHPFFVSFDATAGTAIMEVDGVDVLDTGNAEHILTTGTLASGAGLLAVGALTDGSLKLAGSLGPIGYREASLTNPDDFMNGNLPKAVDEKNWAEWGAQPLFWSHTGEMTNNKGSAGHMTKNGTITMTVGGSP